MIYHIVAAAQNDVIGVDNDLPWSIPEDMRFFRETTKGHAMIMGRKTWESVGHPLPHRLNVVITRQKDYKAEGAIVVNTLSDAIEYCKTQKNTWGEDIYIIGGGEIFTQSMDVVDRIYLTRIFKDYEGEAKYPKLDMSRFKETNRKDRSEPVPFAFLTYDKI